MNLSIDKNTQEFRYCAFGLIILSNRVLEPLALRVESDGPVDVVVCFADVKSELIELTDFSARGVWFYFMGRNRLAVIDSTRVNVEFDSSEVDFRTVLAFVYGIGIAIVLAQRGMFPLHISAVAINGIRVAFGGASGAGKSTTAAACVSDLGAELISDDLGLVRFEGNLPLISGLSERGLKLSSNAINWLRMERNVVGCERDQKQKLVVEVPVESRLLPPRLDGIVFLEQCDVSVEPRLLRLSSAEALILSSGLLYVPRLGVEFWSLRDAMGFLGRLVSSSYCFKIIRPREGGDRFSDLKPVIRELLDVIKGGKNVRNEG